MSLLDAFRKVLLEARDLVDNNSVAQAITDDLSRLDGLAHEGVEAAETHIARWFHGAYQAPAGGVQSPADQVPAGGGDGGDVTPPTAGSASPIPSEPTPAPAEGAAADPNAPPA